MTSDGYAPGPSPMHPVWAAICDTLCRELGRHSLSRDDDPRQQVLQFIEAHASIDEVLDAIELTCRAIDNCTRKLDKYERSRFKIQQTAADAIAEINHRLRRGGCGYQFENGDIVRVDSQYVHAEAVTPALQLMGHPLLSGTQDEFLQAHKHYREGDGEEALVNAGKALESTMKAILTFKKWEFDPKWTAKPLLDELLKRGLLPPGVLAHVGAVRATLEQGVPFLRNNMGGHGQGTSVRAIDGHLVAYGLHLTASAILLLAEAAEMR
jgi:hypothetical protein